MKRIVILTVVAILQVNAACPIPYKVMYSIAKAESHASKRPGYPYIISFNNNKDAKRVSRLFGAYFMDRRSIDCKDTATCIKIAKYLIKNNITNLDLGAFQINYRWHKYPLSDYFNLKASYNRACEIIYSEVKRYGWSWEAIGRYHSYNKIYKREYIHRVHNILKEIN